MNILQRNDLEFQADRQMDKQTERRMDGEGLMVRWIDGDVNRQISLFSFMTCNAAKKYQKSSLITFPERFKYARSVILGHEQLYFGILLNRKLKEKIIERLLTVRQLPGT